MHLSRLFKSVFATLLLLLSTVPLYIVIAFLLTCFPSKHHSSVDKNESIYIFYTDMHSDIVFNLNDLSQPWAKLLPTLIKRKEGYIAFGWGDKETYLNTPTWDDLKTSTALKALFTNSPSLVHVSYYRHLGHFQNLKTIVLSKEQQQVLEKEILKSFDFKGDYYKGYGPNDLFYASPYTYNLFNTCNTWTGDTLRDANISVSYWTPFSQNVIHSLP
ncbi:DUF2459 domain-containing protein [bacterium]|nr:DUF2459 domain-containing protein [bacterium]